MTEKKPAPNRCVSCGTTRGGGVLRWSDENDDSPIERTCWECTFAASEADLEPNAEDVFP